ncbi:hypothetical protein Ccrd_011610 [Cynara cardunculus var. scolymus]|uniref:Uncharacterized protein n=1 Tax=Cynara cardunculus var. scolymus TaxID=59895 RepID=A0A103YJ41_CYNCS|nr:hypothetical protein Ccrd_011610 [Cynara cardunculus var. scolymus]
MLKTKNRIKAAAVTVYPTHLEKTKNNIEDLQIPLSEFKDNGKAVTKMRYSSKRSSKEFVLPQDFIDQQRAYFKEDDEYGLEVEEVSV